jgi:hypothetical protein
MGCPSAPLRRGLDGPELLLQGTMLRVATVSTKYLSLVNLSVGDSRSSVWVTAVAQLVDGRSSVG